MMRYSLISLCLLTLLGCQSTPPFNTKGVDPTVSPARAKVDEHTHGRKALWGGMIVNTHPQKDVTRIEVLAYPLEEDGSPKRKVEPGGRFLIYKSGFIEPSTYAAGRWLSVVGTVEAPKSGKVADTDYVYPVIHAETLHLWPRDHESGGKTRVHFGIGISIHN